MCYMVTLGDVDDDDNDWRSVYFVCNCNLLIVNQMNLKKGVVCDDDLFISLYFVLLFSLN